ncbi:hypothetical protein Q9L58_002219 [Maublancomyces gigas]|uniref:Uncharacterized protein n=1 Tax=Discina gigas TaxID=1032678 RepID=A0ABR3GSF8_9PEZI
MFSRRTLIAICVAVMFSPLGAVLAQESTPSATVDITTTPSSTEVPTATLTPVSESEPVSTTVSVTEPTPPPTDPTDSLGYYLTIPGQTYKNASTDTETTTEESDAGAAGTSDTFINIPLGAQVAIISVVVIAGIAGLVFGWFWYQRRRRQWEIQGRRRSLVPRISRSVNGFSMSRPVYIRDSMAATPIIAVPSTAHRASSGASSVASFNPTDLEKGNERSEFENETKPAGWKTMFSGK